MERVQRDVPREIGKALAFGGSDLFWPVRLGQSHILL